jgi:hypothetical protein
VESKKKPVTSHVNGKKTGNVRTNETMTGVRVTIFVVKKQQILHTLNVCLVLAFQHSMRMHRIILSSVACLTLPQFPTLSHKRKDLEKIIEHEMCFDILYNFCLKHFSF